MARENDRSSPVCIVCFMTAGNDGFGPRAALRSFPRLNTGRWEMLSATTDQCAYDENGLTNWPNMPPRLSIAESSAFCIYRPP